MKRGVHRASTPVRLLQVQWVTPWYVIEYQRLAPATIDMQQLQFMASGEDGEAA